MSHNSYRFFQAISALITSILGLFFARVFFVASPLFGQQWAGESLVVLLCLPLGFWLMPVVAISIQRWVEAVISRSVNKVAVGFWRHGYFPSEHDGSGGVVLDTSAIIDGRIFKVAKSGFLPGELVVPAEVLDELQLLADSADPLKRQRGKRGLRLLDGLGKEGFPLEFCPSTTRGRREVDKLLVQLAKRRQAKLATIDNNLGKVAELSGVPVLNVNNLSLALRSELLPGDEVIVSLVQVGKGDNQGVGYLEDGTMVVVSGGSGFVGSQVLVKVSRYIQTDAGIMVFGKMLKEQNKQV